MTKSSAIKSLPYLWVFVASCCGAWFHWRFFPELLTGTTRLFGHDAAFPAGFRLLMGIGWFLYLFPVVVLLCAAASLRFTSLQSTGIISLFASLLAVAYLAYAFLAATPILLNAVTSAGRSNPAAPGKGGIPSLLTIECLRPALPEQHR